MRQDFYCNNTTRTFVALVLLEVITRVYLKICSQASLRFIRDVVLSYCYCYHQEPVISQFEYNKDKDCMSTLLIGAQNGATSFVMSQLQNF